MQSLRYYYKAFGLVFESDLLLPELLSIPAIIPDVKIRRGAVYATQLTGGFKKLYLPIRGVSCFLIQNGNEIIYQKEKEGHEDSLRLFLLGSAMGALLQQRGLIVLHGNALSWNGEDCSIVVGDAGAGKSTLAAQSLRKGAQVLTDDVSAISLNAKGQILVMPAYPQLKLWQNAIDRKSTRLNSSHLKLSRMPSSA